MGHVFPNVKIILGVHWIFSFIHRFTVFLLFEHNAFFGLGTFFYLVDFFFQTKKRFLVRCVGMTFKLKAIQIFQTVQNEFSFNVITPTSIYTFTDTTLTETNALASNYDSTESPRIQQCAFTFQKPKHRNHSSKANNSEYFFVFLRQQIYFFSVTRKCVDI